MPITATGVAVGLAVWAGLVALYALLRPTQSKKAMTMRLSLTLLRYDEGLALLAQHAARAERWWDDADAREIHLIDRALSMWDLAAWYVATGRVDRQSVLDVFSWQIVDLWERASPYIEHRNLEWPGLWDSLTGLYLDAYDASPRNEVDDWLEERLQRSSTPEEVAEPAPPVVEAQRPTPPPVAVDLRPRPDPEPPRDPWAEALRRAGPPVMPSGGLADRVRVAMLSEQATESGSTVPASASVGRATTSPAEVRPPSSTIDLAAEVEHIVDLTTPHRSNVLG